MTIYTSQTANEKKPEKPLDVVDIAFPEELPVKKDIDDDESEGTASTAAIVIDDGHRRGAAVAGQRRSHSTLCLLIVSLFVVAAGILGGIYLYRHLMHKKFVGYCPVRPGYPESDNYEDGRLRQEHVEIDLQYGEYEKIEVPKLDDNSPVRIIHDFSLNLSAIVDSGHSRCYIMKLDRSRVQPPRNFFDLIQRMLSGEYDVNPVVVRENYSVVRPKIRDYSVVGVFITPECYEYDTYRLRKISEVVADVRSIDAVSDLLVPTTSTWVSTVGSPNPSQPQTHDQVNVCRLRAETGLCRASIPMWAYDSDLDTCVPFTYGGCGGNGNKFTTREHCIKACGQRTDYDDYGADNGDELAYYDKYPRDYSYSKSERFKRSTDTNLQVVYFDGINWDISIDVDGLV